MLQGIIFAMTDTVTESDCFKAFLCDAESEGLRTILVPERSFPARKVAPDFLSSFAAQLRLAPKNCIVLTDTEAGTIAAKSARIPCIGFINPNSEKQNLSGAYALFESFENADAAYLRRTHAHALGYPADILETERLFIRELSMEDFPALYAMCTAPETAVWMEETLSDYATEQEKHYAYISGIYPLFDLALWGVYEKSTGTLIGRVGFSLPEDENDAYSIGYLIDTAYRNKGYAKECVPALLAYAKEQGITTVVARIKKDNLPSQKVIKVCGYSYDSETDSPHGVVTYRIPL